jgi:ribonucleoside-diphosphate reductase alpha chain
MTAATEGKTYVQQYPINSANPTTVKEIDASALWKKIVHNAWRSAEPGVLFWDTIIKDQCPTAMPIWVIKPCRPILAGKFRFARMTHVVCWPSTFTHTL